MRDVREHAQREGEQRREWCSGAAVGGLWNAGWWLGQMHCRVHVQVVVWAVKHDYVCCIISCACVITLIRLQKEEARKPQPFLSLPLFLSLPCFIFFSVSFISLSFSVWVAQLLTNTFQIIVSDSCKWIPTLFLFCTLFSLIYLLFFYMKLHSCHTISIQAKKQKRIKCVLLLIFTAMCEHYETLNIYILKYCYINKSSDYLSIVTVCK